MRTLLFGAVLALASISGCAKDEKKSGSETTAKDDLPALTVAEVDQAIAAKQAQAIDCNGDRLIGNGGGRARGFAQQE